MAGPAARRHHPRHRRRQPRRTRLIAGAVVGLVVVGGGLSALALAGGSAPKPPAGSSTSTTTLPSNPAPTTTTAPQATATTAVPSSTSSTSTSTTSTTTTTATPANLVAPSSVLVEVVNGFGGTDAATMAASQLHSVGFAINGTGDAASFTYTTTVINYAPGNLSGAETLAAHIEGPTRLAAISDEPAADEVTLILGSTYRGIAS